MQIYFAPYSLTPLKRLNRNSNLEPKNGVYLKAVTPQGEGFADYFPHAIFGDKGCDHFLKEFHLQKDIYDQKILHLLTNDLLYQNIPQIKIKNHQLWTGTEDLEAAVIKYKLLNPNDRTFLDPLKRGIRLRLDANALFNPETFRLFLNSIPYELRPLIEYIEDPLIHGDWEDLGVKVATDIVRSKHFDVYIYRPNCQFYPDHQTKNIFSSYLGNDLGRWHTYCELVEKGDLSEIHGIMSRGFYQESTCFMEGCYTEGFIPNPTLVKKMYEELSKKDWIPLSKL